MLSRAFDKEDNMRQRNKITTEDFISRAKEVHGDKFDYSNSVFVNSQTPIEIYCKQHGGVFHQAAGSHLKGAGCALCAGRKKIAVEDFIERSKKRHGNIYDYSLVNEIAGANSKVKIICNKHGVFEQNVSTHMSKCGCPRCSYESWKYNSRTLPELVDAFVKVHGDKYDYSLAENTKSYETNKILCKSCNNIFEQKNTQHLSGHGCHTCTRKSSDLNRRLTTTEFIERAKKKHGSKYCYDKVEYETQYKKVEVVCPAHGSFYVKAANHMSGNGCPSCSKVRRPSTEEFIGIASEIHANKYEYDKTVYVRCEDKVIVTCKVHGDFEVSPSNHRRGKGCPSCAETGFNPDMPAVFYLAECISSFGVFTGYGITKSIDDRFRAHRKNLKDNGFTISRVLLWSFDIGASALKLEGHIKAIFNTASTLSKGIKGFKKESTPSSFSEVENCIKDYLKRESNAN